MKRPFRNAAQAEVYRSNLLAAARKGEAFNRLTGEPASWLRATRGLNWYEFATAYVDMKWKDASAGYRRDIARALTAATPAMVTSNRGRPDARMIRQALTGWGFNARRRPDASVSIRTILRWLERNTEPISVLNNPARIRALLDTATTKLDGTGNAPSTVMRNKAVLYNSFEYAVELSALTRNPLKDLKWSPPKKSHEVDRRCVVNPRQARRLFDTVAEIRTSGPRLVAFFGVMYYAGLRPEEAVNLRVENVTLPRQVRDREAGEWAELPDDEAWGELAFDEATPDIGSAWTDDGRQREHRGLKHRAKGASRRVPVTPDLTRLLRHHLRDPGPGPDGRLFWGVRSAELPTCTYHRVWQKARKAALSAEDYASPWLGGRTTCGTLACPPG